MTPQNKSPPTSSSMEEVAAKRPEEVRAVSVKMKPHEARRSPVRASPPLSALRADSSSIEEERGAWLKRRARTMRKEMTPREKAMWRILHEGELVALNWRRQAPLGAYILDFVSHPARLVVEVDGVQHAAPGQAEHDARRSAWLEIQGYRVLRVQNHEALHHADGVWLTIHAAARETPANARMSKWRAAHDAAVLATNAALQAQAPASPSMGEAPRGGGGGASAAAKDAREASSSSSRATPPQSALRAASSPIEGELGALVREDGA